VKEGFKMYNLVKPDGAIYLMVYAPYAPVFICFRSIAADLVLRSGDL